MRISLQPKITGAIIVISLLLSIALTYVYFDSYRTDMLDSFIKRAKSTAYALDATVYDADISDLNESISLLIQKHMWLDPDITLINFNLKQGDYVRTTMSSDRNKIGAEVDEVNLRVMEGDHISSAVNSDGNLMVVAPIHQSGKIIGTYEIEFTLESIHETIKNELITSIKTGLVTMTLLILSFILFFQYVLIHPIENIHKGLEALSNNDYKHQIKVSSNDEIGELAMAFNQMIREIGKSRKELEDYNKNLEIQVQKRTESLRRKDQQLIHANKKLKELDKQKDAFISVAAHELKTPLTSIKGFAQLMQDKKIMQDRKKRSYYLGLINTNSDRLYRLVLDLVDSSRISLGQLKITTEKVKPESILPEIKHDMEVIANEKKLALAFSLEKGLPNIKADPHRIQQVLRNLIINSIHFTEKGYIKVSAYKKGKYVQFEVKDTGAGIPKENQSRIFSRFYQVDSSLNRKVGGSGLGLSVCKGIVELMKGKIWFESEVNKGTTFYFTIPIVEKSPGETHGKKNHNGSRR